MLFEDGEMLPIMKVYVLTVKDYWSNRVSLDYRKEAILLLFEDSEAITLPKVVKDWLIFFNYLKWSEPIVSPLLTFYDPAKSHRFNRAF